ncbi:MAG TPA: crosslink repair DNA glycosylase YcaQ family protein [Spirochaetia bacterium]|nr:crosslink repair DNA glycosylase YcaQ family protein [Spirochaetia bacterium]
MSVTTDRIRFWSYQRQCLGKRGRNPEQVLRGIIGVYSSHPSAPLSLYARVESFSEQAFYLLDGKRLAFRIPAMRLSVYMIPADTARFVLAATVPPASDPTWEKRYSQKGRFLANEDYKRWKAAILERAGEPLTAKEIREATGIPDAAVKLVLNRMAFEGSLLRVGARNLRSNIISYVSTEAWAKNRFPRVENTKALQWLAGEYLRVFGPVRIKDFQWWAGISAGQAKAALSAHETVTVENGALLAAADLWEFESLKKPAGDSLDILPQWDCYTMGYAPDGRERFVSADMQHNIYGSLGATGGNALGTVLVNGAAHGSWNSRFEGNRMKVSLNMFEKPSGKLRAAIVERFSELALWLKAKDIVLEE